MKPIRVFILEDQPAMMRNLSKLIENSPKTELVGTAFSAEEAILSLDQLGQLPEIILCDIGLPKMTGTDFCRFVKVKYPEVELLMLTVYDDDDLVLEAIKRGAAGYLLKGGDSNKIIAAMEDIREGGSVIQPNLARKLLQHFKPSSQNHTTPGESYRRSLTERELECLQIVAKGLSNTEAASVLGLSKATVRTHLEHIYQKLDVGNRVEAVTEGLRQGLIGI
jgi:DNA-binding NarL/FixJ family response regulator